MRWRMALEKWLYGDPFDIVARMQQARTTWRKEAEFCKFRVKPIFEGDKDQCNQRQGFNRCEFCNLKKGKK